MYIFWNHSKSSQLFLLCVEKFYCTKTGEPLLKCVPSLLEYGKLCSLGAMHAEVGVVAPPRSRKSPVAQIP